MIRNPKEAQRVQSLIDRLGVRDILLMYDSQINMWAVCQVRQKPSHILTMDGSNMQDTQAYILFWIKDNQGKYRVPSDEDVHNVIAIVQRAEVIFKKSESNPNWLDDQMLDEEKSKKAIRDHQQSERIKYIARTTKLKEHIQRELGEKIRP